MPAWWRGACYEEDRDDERSPATTPSCAAARGRCPARGRRSGPRRDDAARPRSPRRRSALDRSPGETSRPHTPDATGAHAAIAALSARITGRLHHDRPSDGAGAAPSRRARRTGDRVVGLAGMARASRRETRLHARASTSSRRSAAHRQLSQRTHDRRDGAGAEHRVRASARASHLASARNRRGVDPGDRDGRISHHRRRALGHRRDRRLAARRSDRAGLDRRARRLGRRHGDSAQGVGRVTATIVPPWPSGTTDVRNSSWSRRFPG